MLRTSGRPRVAAGAKTSSSATACWQASRRRSRRGSNRSSHARRFSFAPIKYRTKELAANVDQVIVVFAARPAFNRWFIWKALVAASAAGIEALVLRNKADLAESDDASSFLQQISELGWRTLALSAKADSDRARELLMREVAGRKSLMVGQSGMGKSTLLNLLIPDARARTQEFSERLNAGKQTTTASRWFTFDGDSALVDYRRLRRIRTRTPALRSKSRRRFRNSARCSGTADFRTAVIWQEPGCAVRAALADGEHRARTL